MKTDQPKLFATFEPCPVCGADIDTSRPAANFWRCPNCGEAIVRRSGRLTRWLDYLTAGTKTKSKRRRG